MSPRRWCIHETEIRLLWEASLRQNLIIYLLDNDWKIIIPKPVNIGIQTRIQFQVWEVYGGAGRGGTAWRGSGLACWGFRIAGQGFLVALWDFCMAWRDWRSCTWIIFILECMVVQRILEQEGKQELSAKNEDVGTMNYFWHIHVFSEVQTSKPGPGSSRTKNVRLSELSPGYAKHFPLTIALCNTFHWLKYMVRSTLRLRCL